MTVDVSERKGQGKRVLVIAYYFPPMGFSGVQRTAKFVRYLHRFGWKSTVVTVRPRGYFAFDQSLLDELQGIPGISIVRTGSLDPTRFFGKHQTVRMPKESRRKALSDLSQWFFLPDNKIGWLPHAFREASRQLRITRFDAILSSAPPYTAHLIGALLSKYYRLPLLLDFRDDWLENPRHVYPTGMHRRLHAALERWTTATAEAVTTINPVIARSIEARTDTKVSILEQGFDPADFSARAETQDGIFRITYTGTFYDVQRPDTFFHGVAMFIRDRPEARAHLRLTFAGTLPEESQRLASRLGLSDLLDYRGYIEHQDVVSLQQRSDVLWMTIGQRQGAESISTGKLFEYFGARRPILALVPEGAAADLLAEHGASFVCDPDQPLDVSVSLNDLFERWINGRLPEPDSSFVRRFDRIRLTERLAFLLNSIVH